jgi:hypothetical protein
MTRQEPQIGDFFEVHRPGADADVPPLLGRVVSMDAVAGPTHGCVLVYVYRSASRPSRDDLLFPPLLTTRAPWLRGYFVRVRSEPLLQGDFFERHTFRDPHGRFVDEDGRPAKDPGRPCGESRILDVAAIEVAISAALATA